MEYESLPAPFLQLAADILGDTNKGLSGSAILSATSAYAVDYDVTLPYSHSANEAPNKRTLLYQNLRVFSASQQVRIIRELCDHQYFGLNRSPERDKLKMTLIARYGHLAGENPASELNETLVAETKHWLQGYPQLLALYEQALTKYNGGAFLRNLLDDLRLSLEKLLQALFANEKSLENQIPAVGGYIKSRGGSAELANMFVKLIDYYAKYQNSYVKHDDAVIEDEIEFVIEISASFMRHFIRLSAKGG